MQVPSMLPQKQKALELFYIYANQYLSQEYGLTWDDFPDYVSPWSEDLTENMTKAMIKVLAVRCSKKLVKKSS